MSQTKREGVGERERERFIETQIIGAWKLGQLCTGRLTSECRWYLRMNSSGNKMASWFTINITHNPGPNTKQGMMQNDKHTQNRKHFVCFCSHTHSAVKQYRPTMYFYDFCDSLPPDGMLFFCRFPFGTSHLYPYLYVISYSKFTQSVSASVCFSVYVHEHRYFGPLTFWCGCGYQDK